MNYKVSIIIPVYNAEKTVRKCVESIVYGLEKSVEVILVDDMSTDNSWTECETLQNDFEQVKCFKNVENKGVSYTRNRGIELACGEYILFVDSDDWVSGKYSRRMVEVAESNQDSLVLCGYTFLNQVLGYKKKYIYDTGSTGISLIQKEQFFELCDKVLLQQSWNKIFRRNIMIQSHIRFDETKSMGEDFQFVLDYMEAINCQRCVILNESLYYYIRANNTSLMNSFGISQFSDGFERLGKLRKLSGIDNIGVKEQYDEAVSALKDNYIYQIVHSKCNKRDKLTSIEAVMNDGQAYQYYKKQLMVLCKEKIAQTKNLCIQYISRILNKMQRIRNDLLVKKNRKMLSAQNVTVISQNCIGGVFCHDMGMEFLSPTINLFIWQPDFVKFVLDFEHYMNCDLILIWGEEYPVGILDNEIRIDFMHYNSCSDAKKKWEERKKRINYGKIVVCCSDRNGFNDKVFDEWKKIIYPKILFTVHERYADEKGSILYSKYESEGFVPDLIPKREFYKDGVLLSIVNASTEEH